MPRQKQLTPLTRKGRPKNSGLRVPHWAHQAIARLSSHTGVSSQKILETALRDGILLVGEPLGSWVKYQQTAEQQWNENLEHFQKRDRPSNQSGEAAPDPPEDSGEDQLGLREDSVDPRLDLSELESGHRAETFATNGALEGE